MPKPKNEAQPHQTDDIIGDEQTPADFIVHSVPTEKEVATIEKKMEREIKDAEIDESLSEIYQDDAGKLVDVSHLSVRKRGFISRFFMFLIFVFVLGSASFTGYKYIYLGDSDASSSIDFKISGNEEVIAGEEFFYTLNYKNTGKISLKNIVVNVKYPDNFVMLDADDKIAKGAWSIDEIASGYSGIIKIKGKMVAAKDSSAIILGSISYKPANFNSEFKKESSFVTLIRDIGFALDFDYPSPLLVGDKSEIGLKINLSDKNYIKNFRIDVDPLENIEFLKLPDGNEAIKQIRPGVYDIILDTQGATTTSLVLPIKFIKKINDVENINLRFSEMQDDGAAREFYANSLPIEVIKSDLNLNLIINGSRTDNGVNFGGLLNYSIVYSNKGSTELKDLVIMSVMESEFLNWSSLSDKNNGEASSNGISWSKNEMPQLASIQPGQEGIIDFSLEVAAPAELLSEKNYAIKSYVQYSVGTSTKASGKKQSDYRSNEITTRINSDLSLASAVRYFDEDNIAVGSGPLPLKIGEATNFRAYWNIQNKLHELSDLIITTKLPDYVSYAGQENVSVGQINYDPNSRILTWKIGKLPLSVQNVSASFGVSVKPLPSDGGKILVILNEVNIEAKDAITGENISKKTMPKTTRLEDDPIANTDGIIAF